MRWPAATCCYLALLHLATGELGVLESWLADFRVSVPKGTVPPVEVDVKILLATVHVKVTVDALVCQHFQVGQLDTAATSGGSKGSRVTVSAKNITVFCEGQVDYWTSLGNLHGLANATLQTSTASGDLALTIPSWNDSEASAPTLGVESCQASLNLELKILSGSFWTQFAKFLPGVIEKIQALTNAKLAEYLCQSALPSARQLLQQWMDRRLTEARTLNISSPPALQKTWVDWTKHELTQGLQQFQKQFLEPNKVYDWLIGQRCMVGHSSVCFMDDMCLVGARIKDPRTLHSHNCKPSINGSFGLGLTEMKWNISDFLVSPLLLQNASIATNLSAARFRILPLMNFSYQPISQALPAWLRVGGATSALASEAVVINVTLKDVKAAANVTAGVDARSLSHVPSFQYVESKCIGPCTDALSLTSMLASFQIENISFRSNSTVPGANGTLLASLLKLSTELLSPSSGLRNFSVILLEGAFQNQFAQRINRSLGHWLTTNQHETCPDPKGEGPYHYTGRILIRPTFGKWCCWIALAIFLLAIFWGLAVRGPRSYSHWFSGALCQSEMVPRTMAVALPVTILACLCFLLGSNYLLMAQTFVNLEAPDFVWNAYQVMVYSLFYSIDALFYEAELKTMSWVVLCFSAVLPYVKLSMMLLCWLMPKQFLPVRVRSWILVIMDEIGKFSLVDVFTVQFLSGVFHIEVAGVPTSGAASDTMRMVLRTKEELGFAAFVFATVASLIIGHLCRHYHEKSVKGSSDCRDCGDVELQEQVDSLETPLAGASTQPRRGWREVLVGPALLMTLLLCIVGCIMPAVSVNLRTVFGPLGSSSFSLFQFAYRLPSFAEHPESFAAVFNQATFIIFALGVNLLQLLLLLLLWYQRMPRWRFLSRINMTAVAHCFSAWAALDVALISMILTMLELRVSDFVHLGGKQKQHLSRLSGIDVTKGDKGLSVDVTLGSGTYILFGVVLFHAWITRTALHCRT